MKRNTGSLGLAILATASALALPGVGYAGNVGFTPMCDRLGVGDPSTLITAAGHTPVPIASATAASLSGLQALMVSNCNDSSMSSTINADIIAAVAGGMKLIVSDWNPSASTAAALPGAPPVSMTYALGIDIDIPTGSPVASGPGGTLTDTSMDGGNYSNHGYTASPLPAGAIAMLTTSDPGQKVGFQYRYGSGTVAYSAIPLDFYFPGGGAGDNYSTYSVSARTYVINLLSFAVAGTTCASEGYTGAKLTWCQNICEKGYTGATLQTWIHRWIRQFRDLPYCAAEGEPEGPGQT